MRDVPCNLLTGFLGSGKTTLLREVMERGLGDARVAIVMNEIGDVGLEGRVFDDLDAVESMVELDNGCVCCSIDEYAFGTAYRELIETARPDLVIIETTGIAEPGPILARLSGMGVPCDAVVTVVDAATFETLAPREPVLEQQVRAADFLVISKGDLVTAEDLERLGARLEALNPRARRVRSEHGVAPGGLLFGAGLARPAAGAGREAEVGEPGVRAHGAIESFSFHSPRRLDPDAFGRVLDELPEPIYRAKGLFVPSTGGDPKVFHFTCGRWELRSVPTLRGAVAGTRAVFIGREAGSVEGPVRADLESCLEGEPPTSDGREP
ncbi:MAG: GTP-binding protein [Planctomycetota bacterium]|jgi:G3E family GTPase|nr:GTP-binding protein [Planctomycetota bacterium]MDP6763126.1 GTP-binding protein [Planctomycetota bacterium]MDP6990291.1 GTP-binding protein [Planctomycetota bacterium]